MVAIALNTELHLKTASHARGQDRTCVSRTSSLTNSASRANLREAVYVGSDRLGTCSRDPIGYRGSPWNLNRAYFVPNATDPSGEVIPILIGIGVAIGIFISPEIVNAPGPGDPVYPPTGPIGSDPELILIGGGIGGIIGGGVVVIPQLPAIITTQTPNIVIHGPTVVVCVGEACAGIEGPGSGVEDLGRIFPKPHSLPGTPIFGHGGLIQLPIPGGGYVSPITQVPVGTSISFFSQHGTTIDTGAALRIMKGIPSYPPNPGTVTQLPGSFIPDYTIGAAKHILPIPGAVQVTKRTPLSKLLSPNMGNVPYAACRTEVPNQ